MFKYLIALLFSSFAVFSQSSPNCKCCTEDHELFDFWIGEWMVTDTNGNQVGQNFIYKIQDGCGLQENWKSANTTGTSYNYFDQRDSTWNQLWIDNQGSQLILKGHAIPNGMLLKSKIKQGQNGPFYHEIKWHLHSDKTVSQTWNVYDQNGTFRRNLFKGIYRKNN